MTSMNARKSTCVRMERSVRILNPDSDACATLVSMELIVNTTLMIASIILVMEKPNASMDRTVLLVNAPKDGSDSTVKWKMYATLTTHAKMATAP